MALNVILTEKDWKMIKDDAYFDVTQKEVKNLLHRMACAQMSRKDIIRMRIKYDPWIDDCEKRFMQELGLDYRIHVISRDGPSKPFHVNGYTKKQWKMLTDESYIPPMQSLLAFMNICRKKAAFEELEILDQKYREELQKREHMLIEKHGLPNRNYGHSLRCDGIDGISFYCWKLLNDDSFVPRSNAYIHSVIQNLRENGKAEDAEKIEQKYLHVLYPEIDEPDMQEEIAAAREFFRTFYPHSFID